MRRPLLLILLGGLCAGVVSIAVDAFAVSGSRPPRLQERRRFLGFEEREQRRYVMGPEESLNEDEYATWTIRLLEIADDGGRFSLSHERRDPASPSPLPRLKRDEIYQDPEYELVEGEVFINLAGFPMWLHAQGRQLFHDRAINYSLDYAFRDGTFLWDVKSALGDVHADVPLPDELEIDPEIPVGAFLFYGGDMACVGRGNTVQWLADAYGFSKRCHTGSLLFINPGLLSLALNLRRPADREVDFRFLSPVATEYKDNTLQLAPATEVDESQQFATIRAESLGRREIPRGDRRVPVTAVLLSTLGENLRTAFVDGRGRVVRLDLGLHPATGLPRWIELVEGVGPPR